MASQFSATQPTSRPCAVIAKDELRARMKRRRAAIDTASREQAAEMLARKLALSDAWRQSETVASFLSFGSEINTSPIDTLARAQGKVIVYPRISEARTLTFHYWAPGEALERSVLGTQEPRPQARPISNAAIDLTLVPLLACDPSGCRLGYGGGFYDRFLSSSDTLSVGLGFHWQLIDHVPGEKHDQRLHAFASDQELRFFT